MDKEKRKKIKRIFRGKVVSDKGDKTIVVQVDTVKLHPRYHKRYLVSKRYSVHDPKNEHRVGEAVKFEECRPLSKRKRWRVLNQVKINNVS